MISNNKKGESARQMVQYKWRRIYRHTSWSLFIYLGLNSYVTRIPTTPNTKILTPTFHSFRKSSFNLSKIRSVVDIMISSNNLYSISYEIGADIWHRIFQLWLDSEGSRFSIFLTRQYRYPAVIVSLKVE